MGERTVVIGLDGFSFEVVDRLVALAPPRVSARSIDGNEADGAGSHNERFAPAFERAAAAGARVYRLAPGVLERVADTVTPQPVLAVVRTPHFGLEVLADATFVVVCVAVRDPGNAGTVIRSADAAGADAVVCCGTSVDPFNPKTVRSSAGSILHVPVVVDVDVDDVLGVLDAHHISTWAALARGGRPYTEVDWRRPSALLLGNEAAGLPAAVAASAGGAVTIPLAGRAESLNVSMAASVLCFEVLRQRSNLHAVEPCP